MGPNASPMRLRRGITLVEMAIVLVVMGLLAMMTLPRIGRGIAQRELDRTAQQLAVDLRSASQLAGRHRRPVRFQAAGTTGYRIVDRNAPATVYIARNFGGASGANATFSGLQTIDFMPNGVLYAPAGVTLPVTFTVTVNANSRSVSVSRAGHVRKL